jgi:hypothetical protein
MTETKTFRILITGSRTWNDPDIISQEIFNVVKENGNVSYVVVHGGAMGADTMADWAAAELKAAGYDISIEEHTAQWKTLGKAAGVLRNQHMVNLGADVCLSFMRGNSNGTRHCTDAAQRAGISVRCFTE